MNQAKNKGGYTLIELLIYTVIFSISVGVFSGVLITFTRVQTQTSADSELTQQLSFVQSTIQRLVRESANIENPAGVASSTLVLRMASSSLDPTIISSDANGIYLKQGTGETYPLTNSQVKVAQFEAVKYENPNAHAIVQINMALTYNSQNPYQQITRALKIAIGRVSAATFDDSLVPNVDNSYSLGIASVNRWKDINISNLLNVGQLINDPVAGAQNGSIYYNTSSSVFRGYTNGSWSVLGGVGWAAASNDIYNTNSGNIGIGVNPPLYKLDVTGTFRATGTSTFSGNVGIGTASPNDTLDINGSIITTGIQNAGKNTKIFTSGTAAAKTLDYMEYSSDGNAQAAYVTDGIVSAVTLDLMEYSSDSAAQTAYVTNASAGSYLNTGGTITTDGNYKVHTFTGGGTFTTGKAGNVAILVVAGGGGGGTNNTVNGGGGAGGLIYNASFTVTTKAYTVTVGTGGAAATNGENSTFDTTTATGGGKGGSGNGVAGSSGGSAGGGSENGAGGSASPAGQGNNGGTGVGGTSAGGGGGGAGEVGQNSHGPGSCGGNGGAGLGYTILDGATRYYAGGGGGGHYTPGGCVAGTGGSGIGGNGGHPSNGGAGVAGTNGTTNTGSGGGGGGSGGSGGSGIVIIRGLTADFSTFQALQSYSEASIKTQGTYSLKGVATTEAVNKTLTRTIGSPINLSNKNSIGFDIRSSRTGSNIKIGIHDSGGTTTEITPNITSAGAFQAVTWDLSGVSNANKDAIDQIIITIVNADAANTFYIDNLYGDIATDLQSYSEATLTSQGSYALKGIALITYSLNKTLTRTVSPTVDLTGQTQVKFDIRASRPGSNIKIGIHDSGGTTTETTPNIASADTYQTITWDISGVSDANKDAIDQIIVTIINADAANTFYIDNLYSPSIGASADIIFTTAGSERMRINPSGNVGIGTADPGSYKLNIAGTVSVNSGTNIIYRCTTAGTLPVGALTINSGNCGASADTGLSVN